jgi:hypothetical protein
MAKFGGTLRSGSLVVMRTTTLPACSVTSNPSIALVCAAARPIPASHSRTPLRIVMALFILCSLCPPVAAR